MLKGIHQQNKYISTMYNFHISEKTSQFYSDAKHLLNFEQEVRIPGLTINDAYGRLIDSRWRMRTILYPPLG